jgi:PncC family amidohydrolase
MSLSQASRRAARLMRSRSLRVVTAESCTAGLVAQSLSLIPGISEFLCGGLVVYRNATKQAFLGVPAGLLDDPGPVSAEVCEAMLQGALDKTPEADVALAVTGHLGPGAPAELDGVVYLGVGRRGEAAAHVCRMRLPKESRKTRQRLAALEALELLAEALAVPTEEEWPAGATLTRQEWCELIFGEVDAVCVGGRDEELEASEAINAIDAPPTRRLIYPGSFNPLHEGHRRLAAWAKKLGGGGDDTGAGGDVAGADGEEAVEVEFEISIENVDKDPLDFRQALARLGQFDAEAPVWLTRAPTFAEKALLFPGATFVVGADTIQRLADLSYYPGGVEERSAAIARLDENDCRFLVFGRVRGEHFLTLAELNLPPEVARLCEAAPAEFRFDIASRDLKRV